MDSSLSSCLEVGICLDIGLKEVNIGGIHPILTIQMRKSTVPVFILAAYQSPCRERKQALNANIDLFSRLATLSS